MYDRTRVCRSAVVRGTTRACHYHFSFPQKHCATNISEMIESSYDLQIGYYMHINTP